MPVGLLNEASDPSPSENAAMPEPTTFQVGAVVVESIEGVGADNGTIKG